MNPPDTNPIPVAGPQKRSGLLWAALRRLLLATTALIIAAALFYGVENLRGSHALSSELAEVKRLNIPIDLAALVLPAVPDDQNLAFSPPFDQLRYTSRDARGSLTNIAAAQVWCDLSSISGAPNYPGVACTWAGTLMGTNTSSRRLNLREVADYFRAPARLHKEHAQRTRARYRLPVTSSTPNQPVSSGFPLPPNPGDPARDVLQALSLFDADLATLAAGARRPHFQFPIRYEDGISALLPHLPLLKRFAGVFTLRAVARLETGQVDAAWEDFRNAWSFAEAPKDEPLLISQLVRYASLTTALQPVWEGITQHRWTPAHLESIQQLVSTADMIPGIHRALAGERVLIQSIVASAVASPEGRRDLASMLDSVPTTTGLPESDGWGSTYVFWAPRGWLYASTAEASKALRQLETASPEQRLGLINTWPPAPPSHSKRFLFYRTYFRSNHSDENLVHSLLKGYRAQTQVRLAQTACALERHRLSTGTYPERLEDLVPHWIAAVPADPIDQKPLRYRREDGDRFRLWSVAANARDDGGKQSLDQSVPLRALDWVWAWPNP